MMSVHEPLARYVKLRVSLSPLISDPDMHHGTCVTHVPGCVPGSLSSGFLWSQWRWKRSRHSRRMRNPHFYVSGKGPMGSAILPFCPHLSNNNNEHFVTSNSKLIPKVSTFPTAAGYSVPVSYSAKRCDSCETKQFENMEHDMMG